MHLPHSWTPGRRGADPGGSSTSRRPRAGFTLLHLILLLATMSAMAALGIPAFFGQPDVTLENAVELLVRDLRDAQDRAAFQHRTLRVAFDPEGDGYAVLDSAGEPIEAPIGDGPFQRVYSVDAVFRGVVIADQQLGSEGALRFGPRGRALNGVRLVLEYGGERRQIQVEEMSGIVLVDGEPYSGW